MKPALHTSAPPPSPLSAYVQRLRDEATSYEHRGQASLAALMRSVVADLEQLEADAREELLTLTDAAEECGYSADHLGRLVRDGTLRNYGKLHAPRVRRGELPKRPATRLRADAQEFTVGTSKRSIARRITGVP